MTYAVSDAGNALTVVAELLSLACQNARETVLVSKKGGLLLHTPMQLLLEMKLPDVGCQRVYDIVVAHALEAERMGPGAFNRCIQAITERVSDPQWIDRLHDSPERSVMARAGTVSDLDWLLTECVKDAKLRPLVSAALQLAGYGGRVIVEKTPGKVVSVERVKGYTFKLKPGFPVACQVRKPLVVCIDGFIESVAEVHHLLEAATESKEWLFLFARGFADDVLQTLKINYDRGSLRVIPIAVKFDLQGLNTLNDLSITSGAELVSSDKGNLISSIRLSDAARVDEVIVSHHVVIVNKKTSRRVSVHSATLRRRRALEANEDKAKLLDERIRTLSPNHVIIRLPDDKDFVVKAQEIDFALRAFRSLIDHGVIETNGEKSLAATALAAGIFSHKCLKQLSTLQKIIA